MNTVKHNQCTCSEISCNNGFGTQTCNNVYRTKNEVVVVVEIPGIKPTDKINMRLRGFKLLIDGKIPNTYPVSEEDIASGTGNSTFAPNPLSNIQKQ